MASAMPLSFLRPLALPRPSTLNLFLRPQAARLSTTTSPSTSPVPEPSDPLTARPPKLAFHWPNPPRTSRPKPKAPKPIPLSELMPTILEKPRTYTLTKTPSGLYPVYTLSKRGGNMKLTKVRRIEGNLGALRGDLEYVLQMTKEQVVINQLTRQIIVKGHKKQQIEEFLKARGI